MSAHQNEATLNETLRLGSFYARHLLALTITVVALSVLWTVAYFVLLLVAVFHGGGIGSPIAYPIGLVILASGSLIVGLTLLFPATAVAEWIVTRRKLPILAQIPLSIASLGLLCLIVAVILPSHSSATTLPDLFARGAMLFGLMLPPMGVYWWTAQGGPLVLALLRRIRAALQRN